MAGPKQNPSSDPVLPGRKATWRDAGLLAAGLCLAAVLIVLSAWAVETTWVRPSVEVPPQGSAGRTQWGGMLPELKNPPRVLMDNDPYYWVGYARAMVEQRTFRIRHTDLDNVPYGRDVHWNSGFSLWLVLCGAVTALVSGQPLAASIETGALVANPILFFLLLAIIGWLVLRRFGGGAAFMLVVLLPLLPAVMWDFGYARPDHHGMHDAAALGLMLFLVLGGAGWVRLHADETAPAGVRYWPDFRSARWAFLASGICGGIGLWVGATQQIFLLTGVGLAFLAGVFLGSARLVQGIAFRPILFRIWGVAGCVTSLVLYAFEYLPNHFAMRLEVNHPLYAIAWLGGAEFLHQAARWKQSGKPPKDWNLLWMVLGVIVALGPLAALTAGPPEWHAWHDPFMRRQHNYINEFEPFTHSLRDKGWLVVFARFGLLPVFVFAAAVVVMLPRTARFWRAVLLVALPGSLITGAMLFVQVRWVGLLCTCLAVVSVALTAYVWDETTPLRKWWRISLRGLLALALLAPGIFSYTQGFRDSLAQARSGVLDSALAWTIASRDVAFNLKRIAAHGAVRVMSGPGQTPALHFFGGVPGTGALYWENIDGVRDAAEFFSDPGDDRAREIARKRGITHVVIEQSPSMAIQACGIFFGREDTKDIEASLAWRLSSPLGTIPDWLEPVPYYGSPMAANFQMRIYRVLPSKL
ncbi:MAG TPA: hypothetical protein PLS03_07765 [Terrimicrobiaceae bacterium]|nr:hypothetical protein [Terrimicrobiaceae bacterium]